MTEVTERTTPTEGSAAETPAAPAASTGADGAPEAPGEALAAPPPAPPAPVGRGGRFLRRMLVVLIIGSAVWAVLWMMHHRPAARRRPPKPKATLVEATRVTLGPARVVVRAMGIVKAAQELDLHPRVQGEVRALSPRLVPGGVVTKGERLFQIDPADYRLAVRQAESTLATARAALQVELGRQAIARREYALLGTPGKDTNAALVLRKPQLRTAEAAVEAAEAALRKARLDLSRTTLRAPWNAVVLSRGVDVGSRVTEITSLAKLVGIDSFWVELVVPVDELRWLRIPGRAGAGKPAPGAPTPTPPGATVTLSDPTGWGPGATRQGNIIQLLPDLEEKGRLARVLVEVTDPLAREPGHAGAPRLLLGTYVQAVLEGAELPGVVALDRRWVRDGNQIWVVDSKLRLEIRRVTLAHRGRDRVLIAGGLKAGERVVTSELVAAAPGMLLEVVAPRPPEGSAPAAPTGPRQGTP